MIFENILTNMFIIFQCFSSMKVFLLSFLIVLYVEYSYENYIFLFESKFIIFCVFFNKLFSFFKIQSKYEREKDTSNIFSDITI